MAEEPTNGKITMFGSGEHDKIENWKGIKYFSPGEFESPDEPGSGKKMNMAFIEKLEAVRKDCAFPFLINSGFRTPAHNAIVGGKGESSHTDGLAADIHVKTSHEMFLILASAIEHGFRRIGIGKTFVHLDLAPDLPQEVTWQYS